MDLVGGYYDAGDNVKFNFPMAFTTTMLSWSVLEFGESMGSELPYASEAIRWGTDYLLKSTDAFGSVAGFVGDPVGDHTCWERPEDMDTPRTSYIITREKPGKEVSAETPKLQLPLQFLPWFYRFSSLQISTEDLITTALGKRRARLPKHRNCSCPCSFFHGFTGSDDWYSGLLLDRAKEVFEFADKYRGSYNDSIGEAACPFYCDFNGYMDELIWSASWLYKATKDPYYLN
ncbi:putative cellulase [Rosa chinensis]|uniref:cellulase n=1 Tax=Rosa chinensis TaxID=74649 RepID=A0A2P6S1L4_ROSCH|nr:putative cellulase [Rosa chinensis]